MSSLLQPEIIKSKFTITGYGFNFIEVNKVPYYSSCIVSTSNEPTLWKPLSTETVTKPDLEELLAFEPDIIILGTGHNHQFLSVDLQTVMKKNKNNDVSFLDKDNDLLNSISVESMSTNAACRTFNILAAEGRQIVAALIIEKGNNK